MPKKKTPAKKVSTKKRLAKKKPVAKKRSVAKKKAAPKLESGPLNWRVVCSKQGVIATGLTRSEAKAQSESHQQKTGHDTTFINGQ